MNDTNITIEMLAEDIRALAIEVNNVALTLSALIQMQNVDRAALQLAAQRIMAQVIEQAAKEDAAASGADTEPEPDAAPLTQERVALSGEGAHPSNAVFFGG